MKAVLQSRYGRPRDVLSVVEVERPAPQAGQVLVEVRAASVHADVWHTTTGRPLMLRFMGNGLFRPRRKIPGTDIAGVVADLGEGVTGLGIGERVFGETITGHQWKNGGAYAEYVALDANALRPIPPGVGFEVAASVPTSGLIAYRTMAIEGRVREGDEVLVNGAGGAVGTVALQVAKALGATVTAVDRAEKLQTLQALGADHVIDFEVRDFTTAGKVYDLIYDIPGNRSFDDLKRALRPGGRYQLIGHDDFGRKGGRMLGSAVPRYMKIGLRRPFGRPDEREAIEVADPLGELAAMLADGRLTPAVGGFFTLDSVADALEAMESGSVAGRIVITP